jgi:serine/threonine protein kinase
MDMQIKMTSKVGNIAYQAPEANTNHYDDRSDVWGAGLILYQLLTGTICRAYPIKSLVDINRRNQDLLHGNLSLNFEGFDPIW